MAKPGVIWFRGFYYAGGRKEKQFTAWTTKLRRLLFHAEGRESTGDAERASGMASAVLPVSSPAKVGDPVFQRPSGDTERLRRTGFPAFAGNDPWCVAKPSHKRLRASAACTRSPSG